MRSTASTRRLALIAGAATLLLPLAAHAAGSITGTIKLDGQAPQRQTIKMSADPQCEAANPGGRMGDVFLVKDGKVQNVFVYVKEGLGDQKFEIPAGEKPHVDQIGCMYTPRVVGVMVGQELEIRNSDPTLHNVHALPTASKPFNNAMPMKGMTIKRKFTAPEVMVRMKCDVHPWMAAYIGVLPHPFFAVSGENGAFTIANVPPGTYTIEAWHEKMGTQTASVTVADGAAANADFTFKPAAE
jgi:plastocyanin